MAEDVGIVMTLHDRVSSTLKTIAGNSKEFDKTLDELEASIKDWEKANDAIVKQQASLKKALNESSVKVQEAQKNYKKLKDETSKGALDEAIEEQTRLKQELTETEKALRVHNQLYDDLYSGSRQAARGVKELTEEQSKLAEGILKSGLLKQAASSLSAAAGAALTSAIGEPTAQLASQSISGALEGASAGAFLGPTGMAIGALIGGVSGAVGGVTAIEQSKDESFKSYVQEAVEGQLEEMESIKTSGSATAGQREQDQIAFAQRFGSEEAAKAYLDQVKAMAVNTNYSYDEITGYSKSLLNTYRAEETLGVLQKLSDATAGLNLDSSGVSMFINGLSRMRTTGKTTQEYLNYFSERGLDVYEAIARGRTADGIQTDKSKVAELVSGGKISGTDAADYILEYIQAEFGGLSEKLASTYDAMVDNLGDAEANLNARMGEGYNEARKESLEAQTEWMDSEELGEAYEAIGAWKASLENAKEQYIRDAVNAALESEEYQTAKAEGDAAEMGRIIMQAKIDGMNEYNANEGKDEVLAQELALIESVRNNTALNEDYWQTGYVLGQEFSKGRLAGMMDADDKSWALQMERNKAEDYADFDAQNYSPIMMAMSGMDVPSSGVVPKEVELLRDWMESQERTPAVKGGDVSVRVTVEQAVVREEADVQKVAEYLADEIKLQTMAGVYE